MPSRMKEFFPSHLKQAHVIPIFKSGDVEDPKKYRPILITSGLSQFFEKVISEQNAQFLDQNILFSSTQFGFRSKFSTTDALLFATEKIRHEVDNDRPVSAALLDLYKAFDSISHENLPNYAT